MSLNHKNTFLRKITGLLLVLALITPSLVKLAHSLEDHYHEVCTDKITEHFHEQEMNCEFQLFHLGTQLVVKPLDLVLPFEELFSSDYIFCEITFTQTAHWRMLLRGPPNRLRTAI